MPSIRIPVQLATPGASVTLASGPTKSRTLVLASRWQASDLLRWTPHHDGGYLAATDTFQGHDWWTKRTHVSNVEEQLYVDPGFRGLGLNPFQVSNDTLLITADRAPAELWPSLEGYKITSGMLSSRELHVQRYGYFEASIKVPKGQALWPAFWLLPASKAWPPEIDAMEFRGHLPNELGVAIHWSAPGHESSGLKIATQDLTAGYRRYGVLWLPDRITWCLDRKPVAHVARSFVEPMHMIINLTVGGTYVGATTPDTPLPSTMHVRYVAAYTTPESEVFNPRQTFV